MLIIPVILSACIVRLRTVADRDTVTARSLLGSKTVRWEEIEGLRFTKGSWARAQLSDGGGAAASRGDVRDAAAADRGQRRVGCPIPYD